MVLVDAGGHYGGYMTDITRTWPNNGKFTDAQRDLYTAVLNVQRECVKLCIESKNLSLNEIHRFAERGLHDQLKQLGFDLAGGGIRDLFPHHVGHFVGIDLHDCATFSKDRKLQAGHVVTIEPGVYIPNDEKWPAHFRGMGIRIEDSVFVGEKNPVVLTVEAVKEVIHPDQPLKIPSNMIRSMISKLFGLRWTSITRADLICVMYVHTGLLKGCKVDVSFIEARSSSLKFDLHP